MERLHFMIRIAQTAAVFLFLIAFAGCSKKVGSADVTKGPDTTDDRAVTPGEGPAGEESESRGDQALKDAFFDFDDYSLSAEARSRLTGNAAYLKEMSGLRVTVEGHCDERGTVEYNLALGQRRADAARGYMVNLGVDSGRLMTISYGEERPFDAGHDESSWSQNRRAHFVVINP